MKIISEPQIIQVNGMRKWIAIFYSILETKDITNHDVFLKYPFSFMDNIFHDKQFEECESGKKQPTESLAYELEVMKPKIKEFVYKYLEANKQYKYYRVFFRDDDSNELGVKGKTFELSMEQYKKYLEWHKSLPKADYGTAGGGYSFIFTPTGLGDIVTVRRDDGHELDLSEVENW